VKEDPTPGAVLFDVDGTLVDTNYLHVCAWLGAFQAVGHPVDGTDVHRAIGMGAEQLLERLLGAETAQHVGAAAREEHTARYQQTFPLMRRFDGTEALLRAVAQRATVVLATSASSAELSALRATLDADDVVAAITSAEDVEAAKPRPDLVEVALERAGVPANRAVFVGDTVWDIEAARRAGVPCVAVLTGGISRSELAEAGAAAVYQNGTELLKGLEASPLRKVFGA
jgi:HAD superfamily hydrolase (TIGR01509 family)